MPMYKTRTKRAEDLVMDCLMREKAIVKPWSLTGLDMQARTLEISASEAPILFTNPAYLRPGYEADMRTVFVPGLFIKVFGSDEPFKIFYDPSALIKRGNCFSFGSLSEFGTDTAVLAGSEYCLGPDGRIERERILSEARTPLRFLRKEYQQLFFNKLDEILLHKNEFFVLAARGLDAQEVLAAGLSLDESLLSAWNKFDFQFTPPAIIIHNEAKENFSAAQAVQLLLLRLLGFDIVLLSENNYSDVENVIDGSLYNLFYCENSDRPAKVSKTLRSKREFIIISCLVLVAASVFILSGSGFFREKTTDLPSTSEIIDKYVALINQSPIPSPGIPAPESDPGARTNNAINVSINQTVIARTDSSTLKIVFTDIVREFEEHGDYHFTFLWADYEWTLAEGQKTPETGKGTAYMKSKSTKVTQNEAQWELVEGSDVIGVKDFSLVWSEGGDDNIWLYKSRRFKIEVVDGT